MKFGPVSPADAIGGVTVHTLRQGSLLLKKGTTVFVSGDLRTNEFTDREGKLRTGLEVTMQDMQILTPKGVQEFGGDAGFAGASASGTSTGTPG